VHDEEDITEIDPADLERLERVGNGCTAEVYRGRYRKLGIEVAIKEIDWNKSKMGAKEQLAFDREVRIMPKVDHPNLVRFVGVASRRRPFQIVTEYCSGGCCFELLHNADDVNLIWEQQCKMCFDVANAMLYLHEFTPQIIHRDLKSLNLLLARPVLSESHTPVVKVSDFGLSRMKDQAPDEPWGKMTNAAGTCHWMAPEVFQGTSYNEKVDIYSYAMILFEIICREIPFEEEEPAKIGRLVVDGHRPDMEAVPPDCPRQLRDLMVRCWDAEAARRPDFRSIVDVLRSIALPSGRAWQT